jgi:hypothetical protein
MLVFNNALFFVCVFLAFLVESDQTPFVRIWLKFETLPHNLFGNSVVNEQDEVEFNMKLYYDNDNFEWVSTKQKWCDFCARNWLSFETTELEELYCEEINRFYLQRAAIYFAVILNKITFLN